MGIGSISLGVSEWVSEQFFNGTSAHKRPFSAWNVLSKNNHAEKIAKYIKITFALVLVPEKWRCPSCHSAASTFLYCQDPSPLSVWPCSPNEWVDGRILFEPPSEVWRKPRHGHAIPGSGLLLTTWQTPTLGFWKQERMLRTGSTGECLRSIAQRTRSGACSYWIGLTNKTNTQNWPNIVRYDRISWRQWWWVSNYRETPAASDQVRRTRGIS